jgi:hypothetical protein
VSRFRLELLKHIFAYLFLCTTFAAQSADMGVAQLRATETRKFSKIEISKLMEAIDAASHEYGFLALPCAAYTRNKSMAWCHAVAADVVTTTDIQKVTFFINHNDKAEETFLRISAHSVAGPIDKQKKEEFCRNFFRKVGDILFIDAQKIDFQEIN